MPKHLVLIIELIQQRRKFHCEFSAVMFHADSLNNKRRKIFFLHYKFVMFGY
jgi:hypothetical protein